MKKVMILAASALLVAGCASQRGYQQPAYQQTGYYVTPEAQAAAQAGSVPPDYAATAADAQIQAVKANYEDVKAQAQAKIDARQKAEAQAAKLKAQQQAAAAKKKAQAAAAAAKVRAEKQAKIDKRNDEKAELQMELLRLDVQKKKAQVGADAAISNATAERAKDFVDNQVEEGRAKVDQIRANNEAIRSGKMK